MRNIRTASKDTDAENPALHSLVKQFQNMLDEARRQGRREALDEITRAFADGRTERNAPGRAHGLFVRQRAPRGASEALVRRALAKGPLTARAIASMAATDEERQLSFSAIYLELKRGKKQRRYLNSAGKWSLVPGR